MSDFYNLMRSMSGQENSLVIPRVYIEFTGSLQAALLLNQLVYWHDKGTRGDGWIYKSYDQWTEETTLSKYHVRQAAKQFQEKGFLETKVMKVQGDPVLHYKLDPEKLEQVFADFLREQWKVKNLTKENTDPENGSKMGVSFTNESEKFNELEKVKNLTNGNSNFNELSTYTEITYKDYTETTTTTANKNAAAASDDINFSELDKHIRTQAGLSFPRPMLEKMVATYGADCVKRNAVYVGKHRDRFAHVAGAFIDACKKDYAANEIEVSEIRDPRYSAYYELMDGNNETETSKNITRNDGRSGSWDYSDEEIEKMGGQFL